MNLQNLSDRVENLERMVSGKHPEEDAYMKELQIKYGTPEEKAAQEQKAAEELAAKKK